MKKEQFIYELIDNYLYYVNLTNIVMENYTSKERTASSLNGAIEGVKKCINFYNYLDRAVKLGKIDENTVNAKLEYVIIALSSKEKNRMIQEIKKYSADYIDDVEEFLKNNLLYDTRGKEQLISKKTIERYILTLRQKEEYTNV